MSRRRRRSAGAPEGPLFRQAPYYPSDDLARPLEPLDHSARASLERRRLVHSTVPLIRTVLNASRTLRVGKSSPPAVLKLRASALVRARATLRATHNPARQGGVGVLISGRQLPARASVCAVRAIRREVLFAIGGRRSRGGRRRSRDSSTKCR